MRSPLLRRLDAALLVAGLVLAGGCGSPSSGKRETAEPTEPLRPPNVWIEVFEEPAVLLARDVRIEGPPGLLSHVAVRQEPASHEHTVRMVGEGLLQETRVRPQALGTVIRGTLGRLAIAAESSLTVLARPGSVPVRILASGDAYYGLADGGDERRGQTLELTGTAER